MHLTAGQLRLALALTFANIAITAVMLQFSSYNSLGMDCDEQLLRTQSASECDQFTKLHTT